MEDLPFRAEYAKSGRAGCKKCRESIEKDTLRLATVVQSSRFDGKQTNWFHVNCFFPRVNATSCDLFSHFEQLKWEDQEMLRKRIEGSSGASSSGASAKKAKASGGSSATKLDDFTVEYSKSNRAKCPACEETIEKDEVRIGKKDYDSESAQRYGPMFRYHHVDCFVKNRDALGFWEKGDKLPGLKSLSKDDQRAIKAKLPEDTAGKKRKAEENGGGEASSSKKTKVDEEGKKREVLKKQNELMFKCRNFLESELKKPDWQNLLTFNKQNVVGGNSQLLDRLSDNMAFGVPERCEVCGNGQLVFSSGFGYRCTGHLSEWAKCTHICEYPKKSPFKVPKDLVAEHPFLASFKFKARDRVFTKSALAEQKSPNSAGGSGSGGGLFNPKKPLQDWKIMMVGKFPDKHGIKKRVIDLGASVTSSCDESTTAVISTEEYFNKKGSNIKKAETQKLAVLKPEFLKLCEEKQENPMNFWKEAQLSTWESDIEVRAKSVIKKSGSVVEKSKSVWTKSVPKSQKLKLKGGAAVDPDSGLEDEAHVYRSGKDLYSIVLGKTDLATGQNSYYKIQILESDVGKRYWVFRAWGRIGTTIGGNKVDDMDSLDAALDMFNFHFEDKTGRNKFCDRHNFQKRPGAMAPLEIDMGDEVDCVADKGNLLKSSTLKQEVEDLIRLIFDVQKMKDAMLEFELDLQKMPLGKLSKNQIKGAYTVLSDAQALLELPDSNPRKNLSILECSNKFYTMIPHDCGIDSPPLLNNEEIIKSKTDMLDNLLEIEVAYSMLESADNSVDSYYKKLNTNLEVMAEDDPMFKLICEYVANTHAETHKNYKLKVSAVFKVARQNEDKRFKPFKALHNRQLLWHGSRLTNYAGILSQGLRIAPPEAPVTGYMFGKGIYFADMVSKSANYCFTTRANPTGLLLLSEVALGNMHELKAAHNVVKPPSGKHSVKGLGMTMPDPKGAVTLPDGLIVPKGTPVPAKVQSTLLYNEFIVYDVAQVNIRYLIKTEFVYV